VIHERATLETTASAETATVPRTRGGRTVVLLGPQAHKRTLGEAARSANVRGQVATITAGWQEREAEDQELNDHLDRRTTNLRLYERADRLFERDPAFAAIHHERQDRLRDLQLYYDLRLRHALEACKLLDERRERGDVGTILEDERRLAMDAVRALDAEHLVRIRAIHDETAGRLRADSHGDLQRHRGEIGRILQDCDALAIAGGHVAVLLNRLRLFGIEQLLGTKPVFAWSAGAMAVGERIVLYHDTPPQGPGNAEVLESGLSFVEGVVPLPHAHRRLLLDDVGRVSRFARRFAPAWCLAMDDGSWVRFSGGTWFAEEGVRVLGENGSVNVMVRR
jgi:hypothetical protein